MFTMAIACWLSSLTTIRVTALPGRSGSSMASPL